MNFNLKKFGNHDKPAILFLHGFMGDGTDWEEVINLLKADFFCVTVDLPGHGGNRIQNGVSMPECAQALFEKLQLEGLSFSGLVGYSMGGRLAIFMAIHYADLQHRLLIESAAPGLRSKKERMQRVESDLQLQKSLQSGDFEDFLRSWYNMPIFASIKKNAKFENLLAKRMNNDVGQLAVTLQGMGAGVQPDLWSQWAELRMPVLLLNGGFDKKYRTLHREMKGLRPQTRIATLSGCGHNTHFEQPEEFADQLRKFLNQSYGGNS